jgi:hypothetical protein
MNIHVRATMGQYNMTNNQPKNICDNLVMIHIFNGQ